MKKKIIFVIVLAVLAYFTAGPSWQKLTGLFGLEISVNSTKEEREFLEKNFPMPSEEAARWDVLILGIRGTDDPDGGLLSDSIMLFSLDKKTGRSDLVSIPRDLYADLPGMVKGKVNEIYERGLIKKKTPEFSKESFSRLTGVYIDNIIVFDFKAFKEIVDDLEGIDIALKKPFEEKNQWGYEFSLPAGPNHLNGQKALYFVRSRYGSSDFDRSLRQQQIILAIKNKAFSTGILSNPIKLGAIAKSLTQNIVTDLNIFDAADIIKLANSFDSENQPNLGHLSTENILYQTFQDDIYVLRPKNNDWNLFKEYFQRFSL